MLTPALAPPLRPAPTRHRARPDEDTHGLEAHIVGWQRSTCALVIVALMVLDALVGESIPTLVQFAMAIVMIGCAVVGLTYRSR